MHKERLSPFQRVSILLAVAILAIIILGTLIIVSGKAPALPVLLGVAMIALGMLMAATTNKGIWFQLVGVLMGIGGIFVLASPLY